MVLKKRKTKLVVGKSLDKQRPITTTLEERADGNL
jgi:hypothetical protein